MSESSEHFLTGPLSVNSIISVALDPSPISRYSEMGGEAAPGQTLAHDRTCEREHKLRQTRRLPETVSNETTSAKRLGSRFVHENVSPSPVVNHFHSNLDDTEKVTFEFVAEDARLIHYVNQVYGVTHSRLNWGNSRSERMWERLNSLGLTQRLLSAFAKISQINECLTACVDLQRRFPYVPS
jgi:hypothetical protein